MLKVEPLAGGGVTVDDVVRVADDHGRVDGNLVNAAWQKMIENWGRRGVARYKKDDIREVYSVQFPGQEASIEDVAEDARNRRDLGQDSSP